MDKWLDKLQDGAQFEGTTNKGFNYNGAWGGQFQKGGKIKPLQVSSKDDPRYKAHQDSLALYQNYQQVKKELSKRDYKHLKNMPLNTPEYDNIIDEVRARLNRTGHEKPWKEYVKDVEKKKASTKKGNLYETSDFIRGVINPDLPSQLYSHTIQPTGTELYQHGAYPPEFHDWSEEQREVWKKQNKDKRYGDARVIANYSNVKPRQEVVIGKPTKKSEVKKEANATNSGYTLQHDGTKYYQSHIPKGKMEVEVVHSTGDRSTKFVDQPSKPKPKPRVREEAITSMSPRGIETHEGIDTPETTLRPMAKPLPEYYDVKDVNPQTFGGYESKYRTENPNDLKELSPTNTREVTPHYRHPGLTFKDGGSTGYNQSKESIESARNKPGGSNVGKYNPNQTFAGPSGGSPRGSYPIGDIGHAKSALKLAHHAPNPSGIKAAVYRKYPELKKGQNGTDMYGAPIIASERTNMGLNRSYYDPRLNNINYDKEYENLSPEERGKLQAHENFHAQQFASDRSNYNIAHNPQYSFQERLQRKPQLPTTDEVYERFHNRKSKEVEIDTRGLIENNPQFQYVPKNILYDKIIDAQQYDNPYSMEGEAKRYEDLGERPNFQSGGNMNYYKSGLDFEPRSISQDGLKIKDPKLRAEVERNNKKLQTKAVFDEARYKEKKQREAKEWVGKSMQEAYKHPLMQPGMLTPEGAAIMGMQAGAQSMMDVSEGNYGKAAINAGMAALPFAGKALGAVKNVSKINPDILTESFKNPTFLQNITDLEDLNTFAKKYNYKLPENLNRIAKSDVLTDRATRGLVNRHNTFMRGVSTNWEHIEKTNPEILKYLESKGIDYANNPKEAAEYMATHIPFDTGYGRASLDSTNKHGLYTSNSLGTAEGYTYGEGYTVKAKRPTDFTSDNRTDWIKNNDFDVYEHSLPRYKEITGWDGAAVANTSSKEEALKYLQNKLDKTTDKTQRFYIEKGLENIDKNYMDPSSLKTNVLKTEHSESVPEDYLLDNVLDPHEFVKHDTELTKIKNNLFKESEPRKQEILKKQEEIFNKPKMSMEDEYIYDALNKELKEINRDVNKKIEGKYSDYLDERFPGWRETLDPNAYAHYIHVGDPGTKVLEAVSSKKITPEIWKNKSRSHRGDYTPKLSKRKEGGVINDEMGQWAHPGEITRIPSNNITMRGVDYPVLGVPNKGKSKMMQPGMDYKFPGASSVTEYPKGKNGKELDQLTNFTNYNKPTKGGWLDQL